MAKKHSAGSIMAHRADTTLYQAITLYEGAAEAYEQEGDVLMARICRKYVQLLEEAEDRLLKYQDKLYGEEG